MLMPILVESILVTGFSIVQCALLHPRFQGTPMARWIRLSLAPFTIGWWLCLPSRLPPQPYTERTLVPAFVSTIMAFKSIEWSFATGPYRLRTLKRIDGVGVWEKEPAPESKSDSVKLGDFVVWIILLFSSQRGYRWSWGPQGKANTNSFAKSMVELIRLQLVMLPSVAFLLASQDHANYKADPTAALLKLGFRSFPGISLLAECVLSASFMFLVSSAIEMTNLLPMMCTYLLYPLAKAQGFPSRLSELFNPEDYPLQFGSLFDLSSVSHFWGKFWHQKLRRPFLFCGGKPAISLARYVGASENVQKICGVMAVFALSGIYHEYPLYLFHQAPHPHPRVFLKSFPGTFLFFFVQSFGVIFEPLIIPRIPRGLGGGRVWTLAFLLLTAPLFTHDVLQPGGPLNDFAHPSQWTWLHFLVPVPFAKILSPK